MGDWLDDEIRRLDDQDVENAVAASAAERAATQPPEPDAEIEERIATFLDRVDPWTAHPILALSRREVVEDTGRGWLRRSRPRIPLTQVVTDEAVVASGWALPDLAQQLTYTVPGEEHSAIAMHTVVVTTSGELLLVLVVARRPPFTMYPEPARLDGPLRGLAVVAEAEVDTYGRRVIFGAPFDVELGALRRAPSVGRAVVKGLGLRGPGHYETEYDQFGSPIQRLRFDPNWNADDHVLAALSSSFARLVRAAN